MDLKEVLFPIVRNAGRIILGAHGDNIENNVYEKDGDANFVTAFDVETQEYLITEIKKAIPDAFFMAEEQENDTSVLMNEHCFVIDPIDGTTNFIHNYKRSSISIAMFSFGVPVLGIVYDPYLDELYYAEKGRGAYLNGSPICVSKRSMNRSMVVYGTSPYYKKELGDKTFALCKELFLTAADVRRTGSAAIDLASIASGRADVFFEMRLSPWDIAAGYVLICEAGGCITDMSGKPIDFTKPSSVIASNRLTFDKLLEITKKY